MKQRVFITILLLSLTFTIDAQIKLKDIYGNSVNTDTIVKMERPVVITFFSALWCNPCLKMLDKINDDYIYWNAEFIAVSVDESRYNHLVKRKIEERVWDFSIWLDSDKKFARMLSVGATVPVTFIFDAKGKLVCRKQDYSLTTEEISRQLDKL